jgi:hypothetical protein
MSIILIADSRERFPRRCKTLRRIEKFIAEPNFDVSIQHPVKGDYSVCEFRFIKIIRQCNKPASERVINEKTKRVASQALHRLKAALFTEAGLNSNDTMAFLSYWPRGLRSASKRDRSDMKRQKAVPSGSKKNTDSYRHHSTFDECHSARPINSNWGNHDKGLRS